MFNAMTFQDVKSFMIIFSQELNTLLTGKEGRRLQRADFTDEELSVKIAKQLEKLCSNQADKQANEGSDSSDESE